MGVRIVLAKNEPIDIALRRFEKILYRTGLDRELSRRESYKKPTQIRRTKQFNKRLNAQIAAAQAENAERAALLKFWKKSGNP